MALWRTRIACWIPRATHTHTHTHSEYVIFTAFPLQQCLQERTSMLRHTHKAFIVVINGVEVISDNVQNCGQHLASGSQRIRCSYSVSNEALSALVQA
jgi:hypothetical protein